jgi:hypothetical protein
MEDCRNLPTFRRFILSAPSGRWVIRTRIFGLDIGAGQTRPKLGHTSGDGEEWVWTDRIWEPVRQWEPVSTRLHGVTSQETVIFVLAAVRTWNLTTWLQFHRRTLAFFLSWKQKHCFLFLYHINGSRDD